MVQTRILCPQWGCVWSFPPEELHQDREEVLSAGEGEPSRTMFIQEKVEADGAAEEEPGCARVPAELGCLLS